MSCRAAFWYGNVAGHLGHGLCLGLCCSPKLAHRKSPGKCEGAKLSSLDTVAIQPDSPGRQGMLCVQVLILALFGSLCSGSPESFGCCHRSSSGFQTDR